MRDEKAIRKFERTPQGGDLVLYSFGDTSVLVEEWTDRDGDVNLRPVRGDQVACGEWYDLPEDEVAAYCEMLQDEIRGRKTA